MTQNQIYNVILNADKKISIEIPKNWKILQELIPKYYRFKINFQKTIQNKLDNPYGTEKLESLLKKKRNIVIISDDQTRPTPVYELISEITQKLNKYHISKDKVRILIGRGLHVPPNKEEIRDRFKDLVDKYSFFIHNPDENFKFLGTTTSQVPVEVNEIVANADFRISLGTVEPHELTGFTGGAAIIVPGIASRKTIRLNHSLLFKNEEINSYFGNLNNNPIRSDMEEAAKLVKLDFIVNVIQDTYNQFFDVYAGDYKEAHRNAAESVKYHFGIKIHEKADICIITAYPKHKTIGKGLKALYIGDLVTKKDGTIICFLDADSISASKVFEELLLKNLKVSELFALLKKGELPGEACVLYLFSKLKKKKIIIITKEQFKGPIEQMGLIYAKDFEEAVRIIDDRSIKTVHIIPEGMNLLPLVEN